MEWNGMDYGMNELNEWNHEWMGIWMNEMNETRWNVLYVYFAKCMKERMDERMVNALMNWWMTEATIRRNEWIPMTWPKDASEIMNWIQRRTWRTSSAWHGWIDDACMIWMEFGGIDLLSTPNGKSNASIRNESSCGAILEGGSNRTWMSPPPRAGYWMEGMGGAWWLELNGGVLRWDGMG